MQSLGDQVKAFRDARRWDVKTLAAEVGTSRQNIQSLERTGNRIPKYLGRLAEVMGLSADVLLARAGLGGVDVSALGPQAIADGRGISVAALANSGSMGPGQDHHEEVIVGRLTLSPEWISKTIAPTAHANLRFIHGYGDSMEPTFYDGDVLLVDSGVRECRVDGIYVLNANERVYIKRVRQRMDGSYEISSDNVTVKTVDILDGTRHVEVLGRVVLSWNAKKL